MSTAPTDPVKPFLSIGYEDLGEPLSSTVRCFHCGAAHPVESSGPGKRLAADGVTWEPTRSGLLQFYHCEKMQQTYLVGIENRRIRK